MNFAFLLIESPYRLNQTLNFLLSNLKKSNEAQIIFILTKIDYSFNNAICDARNNTNSSVGEIHKYTYSTCTPMIFDDIIKRKNLYCFFEVSSDLAKYSSLDKKANCLLFSTETISIKEICIVAKYLNNSLKEPVECFSYLRKIGKRYALFDSGNGTIDNKMKNIYVSRKIINFTEQRYSQYQSELASIPMSELSSSKGKERVLETLNEFTTIENNKYSYLFVNLAINDKHIIFGRFNRNVQLAYKLFNDKGKKCYLYSKTNSKDANLINFNLWVNSPNGILFLCISLTDLFWSYDIRKVNNIILLETCDDNYLLKFHELVDLSTGYSKKFWNALSQKPEVNIFSMCYQAPDGTELVEEEYFKIVTKKNEMQKLAVEILKNGYSVDIPLDDMNELMKKDLLTTDYQRLFHDKLDLLI